MEKEWKPFRFKAKTARAGTQYHFNIPAFAIKNNYINIEKEYTIYFADADTINIETITLTEIKTFISFKSSPASTGKQYRLTIPAFLIKNKYFNPEKKTKYWVFMVDK